MRPNRFTPGLIATVTMMLTPSAKADIFGADVAVLSQILIQSIQTVIQLKSILDTGDDTLSLLRDVNAGVASGLDVIRIANPSFNPGVYGNLNDANSVLRAVQDIYGTVPHGPDESLMNSQDQSVAETIAMNRSVYDYAETVDREKERIIYHAGVVSPQGAAKLQGQALGVLIGVATQILRVESQILKLTAQNMAMQNRREKISTESFQQNYRGISDGLHSLPSNTELPRIGGNQ